MKKQSSMSISKKISVIAIFAILIFNSQIGCVRTVREDKVVTSPTTTSTTTVVERETVTDENTSVLGTVFDVVGEVIALPFRLVAGIFRFVF